MSTDLIRQMEALREQEQEESKDQLSFGRFSRNTVISMMPSNIEQGFQELTNEDGASGAAASLLVVTNPQQDRLHTDM